MPKVPSPKKKVKRSAEYKRRSAAAKKGWEARRKRLEAELLETKIWGIVLDTRDHALNPARGYTGSNPKQRNILTDLILDEDPRWVEFSRVVVDLLKLSPMTARNAWFSPKAQKVVFMTT